MAGWPGRLRSAAPEVQSVSWRSARLMVSTHSAADPKLLWCLVLGLGVKVPAPRTLPHAGAGAGHPVPAAGSRFGDLLGVHMTFMPCCKVVVGGSVPSPHAPEVAATLQTAMLRGLCHPRGAPRDRRRQRGPRERHSSVVSSQNLFSCHVPVPPRTPISWGAQHRLPKERCPPLGLTLVGRSTGDAMQFLASSCQQVSLPATKEPAEQGNVLIRLVWRRTADGAWVLRKAAWMKGRGGAGEGWGIVEDMEGWQGGLGRMQEQRHGWGWREGWVEEGTEAKLDCWMEDRPRGGWGQLFNWKLLVQPEPPQRAVTGSSF